MAEELKSLIAKIRQEGLDKAEAEARQVLIKAQAEAEKILRQAKDEAGKIAAQAAQNARESEANTKALLQQAGRDLLLSLRREINDMLYKLITQGAHSALTAEESGKIILGMIKDAGHLSRAQLVVSVKKEDLHKLEKFFLHELSAQAREGLELKGTDEIRAGFAISFDGGGSQFDFTDRAMAEYIYTQLKPELENILKG
jgi:V/A-type H+-transporting ATPase subunit E